MHFKIATEADTSKFTEKIVYKLPIRFYEWTSIFSEMFIFDSAELLELFYGSFNAMSILKAKDKL